MEKITYPPLIAHLKEESDYYNQQYQNCLIKYGGLDSKLLAFWMIKVIEPVVKEVSVTHQEKLGNVCRMLYSELLQLLGNKSGIIYEKEYLRAWGLFTKTIVLFATQPRRMIKAIHSAMESIRIHQPEHVESWIEMMEASVGSCNTIEEFLACGRIHAWQCGMAHLRFRAQDEYLKLSEELKKVVEIKQDITKGLEEAFGREWIDLDTFHFVGEAGGFSGYGGSFKNAPIIGMVGGEILATDRHDTFAFFGDTFGKVLLPNIPISPDKVVKCATVKDLESIKKQYGRESIPFDDITSCAVKQSTLVLTRASSHYLYVYGWPV